MTWKSQREYWNPGSQTKYSPYCPFWIEDSSALVYGGTVNEVLLFTARRRSDVDSWGAAVLSVIDLGACLVADTAILPLTIFQQLAGVQQPGGRPPPPFGEPTEEEPVTAERAISKLPAHCRPRIH